MPPFVEYQVALDWDNDDDLKRIVPQPASPDAMQVPDVRWNGNMEISYHGADYMDLVWTMAEHGQRATINQQFGVSKSAPAREVTVQIPDDDGEAIVRNAVANLMPQTRRTKLGHRNHIIRLTNIHELTP